MTEGLSGVMSRINQIRSGFGAGGTLGVSAGGDGGFDQLLQRAGSATSKKAYSANSARKSSSAASDPLERIAIPKGTRKPGTSGADSPYWPDGVPVEAEQYADEFIAAAEETGVPLQVLLAVARAESGFNPDAESPAGAIGMMQLMPGTAEGLGVDPTDPAQNILGGARYLAAQYDTFGSWDLAFAAYNAGPGAVDQYGGIPPYRETQNYVDVVNEFLDAMTTPATAGTAPALTAQRALGDTVIDLDAPVQAVPTDADAVALTDGPDAAASTVPAMPTAGAPGSPGGEQGVGDFRQQARNGVGSPDAGAVGGANAAARRDAEVALPTVLTTPAAFGEQLLAQVQRTKADGGHGHRLNVRLDPPELGRLDVSFEMRGEQVYVVVRPEKAEGGALMAQQRDRIAQLFAREGLQLSSFDVGTSSQSQGRANQNLPGGRAFIAPDLDLTSEVAFTVDRELRL